MKQAEREPAMSELRKLLRFLSGGPADLVENEASGETIELIRSCDRGRRVFARDLVNTVVSRGLVRRNRNVVDLAEPGRDWLRRAMCDSEVPFAAQHGAHVRTVIETEDGRLRPVTVNADESPLAALRRLKGKDGRRFLDPALFEAGERLRADFTRGQLQPRISANWEASVSGGGRAGNGAADLSDAALAARMRVDKALAAVGPELSGVLVDVCCFLKGLEAVERERQWPVRSAKLMLKAALSTLDRHYRPEGPESRQAWTRRRHSWAADGGRPTLRRA